MGEADRTISSTLRVLACGAAGVSLVGGVFSALLLMPSWSAGAALPGCGGPGQGGCGAVLASRWSDLFGLPVPIFAIATFLAALIGALGLGIAMRPRPRRWAGAMLLVAGLAAALSGTWFIFLQLTVVGQICPYCMVVDGSAIVLGVLAWFVVTGGGPAALLGTRASLTAVLVAGLGTAGLIAGQSFDRSQLRVLEIAGQGIRLHHYPKFGSAEAPHVLFAMVDYTCPHCRRLHDYLMQARRRYGEQLAIAIAPTPLDTECNPAIEMMSPAHENACELANLALAVWRAEPSRFPAMDRWLFGADHVRSVEAARQKAKQLVGVEALERTLAHDQAWRSRFLAAQGRLNQKLGEPVRPSGRPIGRTLPKLVLPSNEMIAGRPPSAQSLFKQLEKQLGLEPVASSTQPATRQTDTAPD